MAKKDDKKTTVNKTTVKPAVVPRRPATTPAAVKKKSAGTTVWKPIQAVPVVKSREATPGWFDTQTKKKNSVSTRPPVITPPVITPPVVNPPVVAPPTRGAPKFASALVRSTAPIRLASHKFDSPAFKGYDAVRGKPAKLREASRARIREDRARVGKKDSDPDRTDDRDCTKSKERPKENAPKKGGGSGKKFVPWKGTKYGC